MTKSTKPDTWAIWPENYEEIKASVRSLLSKDRATLKKQVEELKFVVFDEYRKGTKNKLIEVVKVKDLLALLGDTKEEK